MTLGGIRAAPVIAIRDSSLETLLAYKLRIAITGEAHVQRWRPIFDHLESTSAIARSMPRKEQQAKTHSKTR